MAEKVEQASVATEKPNPSQSSDPTPGSGKDANVVALKPDRAIWIVPHSSFTKVVEILDITSAMPTYTAFDDEYHKAAVKVAKENPPSPTYKITKNWIGSQMQVQSSEGTHLADWKSPWHSMGKTQLTFPSESKHCSHPIEMKPLKFYRRSEGWVQDSVSYHWEMDSKLKQNHFTLFKLVGESKVEIGKYMEPFWTAKSGGVLAIDSKEVDELIAALTCCVILKKNRMRVREHSSAGGGGGGGGGGS